MGSGKTSLGKKLAKKLAANFMDLDTYIENKEGKSISQLFHEFGERKFRDIELQRLTEVLKIENVILATGGGTPCYFNNINLINSSGTAFYLFLKPEQLFKRLLINKTERPLIKDLNEAGLMAFIKKSLLTREPFYLKATYKVQANNSSMALNAIMEILKNSNYSSAI